MARLFEDLPDNPAGGTTRRGWRDRGWQTHAGVFGLTSGATVALWLITRDPTPGPLDEGAGYWWPLWFGLVWSVAVLLHFLLADGRLPLPGSLLPNGGTSAAAPTAPPSPPPETGSPNAPPPDPVTAETERKPPNPTVGPLDSLTARERQILALLAQGCSNKEIAQRLYIGERTARTHVSNILRKLDLPSRTHAALAAVQADLVRAQRSEDGGADQDRM